jgi:hypothetical protein
MTDTPAAPMTPHNPINARPGSDFSDREFMDIIAGDGCPHGNGLSCRDCQLEAEAEDATWD